MHFVLPSKIELVIAWGMIRKRGWELVSEITGALNMLLALETCQQCLFLQMKLSQNWSSVEKFSFKACLGMLWTLHWSLASEEGFSWF